MGAKQFRTRVRKKNFWSWSKKGGMRKGGWVRNGAKRWVRSGFAPGCEKNFSGASRPHPPLKNPVYAPVCKPLFSLCVPFLKLQVRSFNSKLALYAQTYTHKCSVYTVQCSRLHTDTVTQLGRLWRSDIFSTTICLDFMMSYGQKNIRRIKVSTVCDKVISWIPLFSFK